MLFNTDGSPISKDDEITTEAMSSIVATILTEGLTPEELNYFLADHDAVEEAIGENILLERTIVRLDKKAKLSKAHKMAVFEIAKERKDPKFKKLLTVWKMERFLENYLVKKYGNEAMRRAKKSVAAASKSKSAMVRQAANNVKKQFNPDRAKAR